MHSLSTAEQYRPQFEQVGQEQKLDPNVLEALMMVESSGQESISPAGARGIMQTLPNWWHDDEMADWKNPLYQVRTGARAIKAKLEMVKKVSDSFGIREAVACYFGCNPTAPITDPRKDIGGMDTATYVSLYDKAYKQVAEAHGSGGGSNGQGVAADTNADNALNPQQRNMVAIIAAVGIVVVLGGVYLVLSDD